jgi:hypothetical protein
MKGSERVQAALGKACLDVSAVKLQDSARETS